MSGAPPLDMDSGSKGKYEREDTVGGGEMCDRGELSVLGMRGDANGKLEGTVLLMKLELLMRLGMLELGYCGRGMNADDDEDEVAGVAIPLLESRLPRRPPVVPLVNPCSIADFKSCRSEPCWLGMAGADME